MPFLAVVHLRELACPECEATIAQPGSRSFVVDPQGAPVNFHEASMPSEMALTIVCPNGHIATLLVPNEVGVEETLATPVAAPIAADAVLSRDAPTRRQ